MLPTLWCRAMIKHQDHRFPGITPGDGLQIDFDKDANEKRNKAHARDQKQQQKEALLKRGPAPGA